MLILSLRRARMRVLPPLLVLGLALGLPAAGHAGRPLKPGTPTDLAIGTITMSNGSYVVPVSWKAGANTASVVATVTAGGTALASATLTGTSWAPSITGRAGTSVTVSIYGVNGRFRSATATASKVLPDVTAPVGAYTATWTEPDAGTAIATFTRVSLADDVTGAAGIGVVVDFGDGSAPLSTNGGQSEIVHSYSIPDPKPHRFQPQIRLTDAAGNVGYAGINAVVVNDTTAPLGSGALPRAAGWAGWTPVSMVLAATDNLSPVDRIKRTVDWGDGHVTTAFGDGAVSHVYATAGTYLPTVRFEDEAIPANASPTSAPGAVTIKADVFRPSITLTLPRSRRSWIRSWKVLRGSAADGQTAVRTVRVKAVEKRGSVFYAYVPARRRWVEVGRKSRAFARAGYLERGSSGAWRVRLPKLTRGVLLYRAESVDAMGNVSLVAHHRQRLTRR